MNPVAHDLRVWTADQSRRICETPLAIELQKREPLPGKQKAGREAAARDEKLRRLLVTRRLRVTSQRLAVLRELETVDTPISHPELAERLSSSGVDGVTVYRCLLILADAGILVRTELGDCIWRYELPRTRDRNHGRHPHFVCTECGTVRCLPAEAVVLKGEAARSRVMDVQLRGRCSDCIDGAHPG